MELFCCRTFLLFSGFVVCVLPLEFFQIIEHGEGNHLMCASADCCPSHQGHGSVKMLVLKIMMLKNYSEAGVIGFS